MARAVTQGPMLEYISNIDFSLNFEDTRNSVKVHIGNIVHYDGMIAKYKKNSGEEVSGRTSSLSSAIASNWLTLHTPGNMPGPISIKVDRIREGTSINTLDNKISDSLPPPRSATFDPLRGGEFDKFLETETKTGTKIIQEKDRIVKKLDIVKDQVNIKNVEATTVSSSTAVPKEQKAHSTKIISSEHYNAESSIPLKFKTTSTETKKANTFTVDPSTPKLFEDPTLKEINRVTKPVVHTNEAQDAVVVKKLSGIKMHVDSVEGITLKNEVVGSSGREIDTSAKASSGKSVDTDYSVKTASGSTPITDLSSIDKNTEDLKNQNSPPEKKNYLKMLPEEWSKLHWVKKEQFVKQQTDKEFVKFILLVDPVKAVQNACRKRLVDLEKLAMGK
jgi:hypothetical protein